MLIRDDYCWQKEMMSVFFCRIILQIYPQKQNHPTRKWRERVWSSEPEFLKNRFQGVNSARLCSLAGRYDNPIPTRFLAPIDCLKIAALGCNSGENSLEFIIESELTIALFSMSCYSMCISMCLRQRICWRHETRWRNNINRPSLYSPQSAERGPYHKR